IQLPQIIFQPLAALSASIFPKSGTVAIIGLVMSLGYLCAMILSCSILKKRRGEIDLKELRTAHLKCLLAAISARGAGCGLPDLFPDVALAGRWQAFATTALVGSVMLVFFIGACYLLRVRELHSIIDVVAGKLRRAA